ncbi:mediator of RNA polymerase II transcription subunit 1 [Rhagoletis pomonella]|uniref:mediator of RNA polymerase II transcription subunit 1 n=1 Tax=Rhagoletis pomonella TaxID=28610 RepID=UPI001786F8FD|nr:mediator of RNA polymerase II transcription subunit 1 [Rhagoletis pomonella]
MERGASGSSHHHPHAAAASTAAAGHSYMTHHGGSATAADVVEYEYNAPGKSSFDNPATKKKPPKLKAISRSLSMAIDNYAPHVGSGGGGGTNSPPTMMLDDSLIVEQPLIHRSASPLPLRSAPPQTLTIPAHQMHGGDGSRAVSPALSARQQHHHQQQHSLHSFQNMVARQQQQQQQAHHHTSSTSSPTSHAVSPLPVRVPLAHQPDIYLVSSSSLGEDVGALGGGARGGSSSPIQFIDDYMLPPSSHRHTVSATHPLKKNMFRRSDTIDVHPASTFQMKKTHSFHAQQDSAATMDQMLLSAAAAGASQGSSASSSRRTSSVRGNFLMPGHPGGAGSKELSRSPSPSRRGCRSHRSFNDPGRRPSIKPESVVESQIRHPSLNDELMESLEGRSAAALFPSKNLSLENELFVESRSRSNSSTKMEDVGMEVAAAQRAAAILLARKSSGSFEDGSGTAAMVHSGTHPPPTASSSLKKRGEHPHSRQHSSQSLELDGRPSTSAAAAAAAAAAHGHQPHALQLHSAAAAATAAYHFKRGAQHGRSLYLSPKNLEELQVHQRSSVLAAAAAFQGTNASASVKQAKALHSASMRLRTYRETLSATKKSKSFIGDSAYPPTAVSGNDFELTSPHRRNSRPLSSAVGGTVDDIKRSPRPLALTPTSAAAATAFMDEKRPSFERKSSLTYELGDAAFEQVLRPFHHKVAGRKASMSGGGAHKALKKKSPSDETDEDEEEDRKRKRMVCISVIVFLCLACASALIVIIMLQHSSGQSSHQHGPSKKIYTYTRETPVHYNGTIWGLKCAMFDRGVGRKRGRWEGDGRDGSKEMGRCRM